MNAEHGHYHEEAQVVVFTTVSYSGFELNVTARQGATKDAILDTTREMVKALAALQEAGAVPVVKNGNGNGHAKAANAALASATPTPGPQASPDDAAWNAMQSATQDPAVQAALAKAKANGYPPAFSQPQPQQPQAPTLAGGVPDPAWCPIHAVAMKRHEKDGNAWYSHKAPDGTWCRGKRKEPPSLGY